ncbi:adenylosuccinate lyase [Desulfobacterales bacterium HSG16]|nr:adenylosuccinate lyase [Desulfobacterales bacterium HSG16]
MDISELNAISPIDGRYRKVTEPLAGYFSESSLIKYRVLVEVEYFIALCELPLPQLKDFDKSAFPKLRAIYKKFSEEDAQKVKHIERTTNHDVKAVEYFVKDEFDRLNIGGFKEFIHFGLTSQDINNTAVPYSLKMAWTEVLEPALSELIRLLISNTEKWEGIPMLARTHGQPASPTRMSKEIMVFVERVKKQMELVPSIPFSAKFGGATGNFNAHYVAYPDINWPEFANRLVNDVLELHRSNPTTQIEHYDNMAAFFDNLKRINTILLDLDRDMWTYISMNYFKQKIKAGEVGSSAMPHKVNPIDFENSEGNLGIANAFFEHLSGKLPISRLQRDLTDSTVTRNIGMPFSHMLIGIKSLIRGFGRISINKEAIVGDLADNWQVVAEGIQTILRREGYPQPYEALKDLTRTNDVIDQKAISDFIANLDVTKSVKEELDKITPENYIGV